MRMFLTTVTLAALLAPALPAGAQVYPDRVQTMRGVSERARVERYQRGGQRATETERITKTLRLGSSGELDVSNLAGDIQITRGAGNDVTIEAVKTSRAQTADEARQMLPLVEIDIVERAGRIEVRTRYPRSDDAGRRTWRNVNVSVAYTITTPDKTRVIANSVSGSLSVRDIKGDLALETISGDVRVANAGRVSKAKTASGDVEIADTTIEGTMDASTISGTMLLRNVTARRLDVGSISGAVVLQNVECERIDAQAISGDVRLSGPLVRGGRYKLGSHAGEVRVVVSGDVGFELEASSFSGVVRTDLDVKPIGTQPESRRGRGSRSLRGTYGDGGAFLELSTFSGSVIVSKQ